MATPNDPNPLDFLHNPYGNFTYTDGKYRFEWTPFTPAIRAWESAQRYLTRARDCLIEARKVNGFAIPGLEVEYSRCIDALGVFTDDVDKAARAAGRMAQALDVANFDYAKANDASLDLYRQVNRTVAQAASEQGRPSPVINTITGNRVPDPLPTGPGFDHGN